MIFPPLLIYRRQVCFGHVTFSVCEATQKPDVIYLGHGPVGERLGGGPGCFVRAGGRRRRVRVERSGGAFGPLALRHPHRGTAKSHGIGEPRNSRVCVARGVRNRGAARRFASNKFSKGFGFVAVAAGGATLVMGATLLAIPSPAEKRYGRWPSVQSQGVSDVELARFEGELRYSLTVRANGKLRQRRWGSLGLVLGGASLIGLTAASNLSTLAQRLGYGVGGTLAGVGMVGFGLSFMKPRDLWERYEVGLPPRGTELVRATLKITPLLTRRAAGLCVNARF